MGKHKKDKQKQTTSLQLDADFPSLGPTGSGSENRGRITGSLDIKHTAHSRPSASSETSSTSLQASAPTSREPSSLMAPSVWTKSPATSTATYKEGAVAAGVPQQKQQQQEREPPPEYIIHATKTAKLPLQVEKRRHKTVTVVRNVSGEAGVLLTSLKLALGSGGKLVESEEGAGDCAEVEIQGDHLKRVAAYICQEHFQRVQAGERGLLKGVSKGELAAHCSPIILKKEAAAGTGKKSIVRLDQKAAALKQKAGQSKKR